MLTNVQLDVKTIFIPEDCSRTAKPGDVLFVHYEGKLDNGKVFDKTRDGWYNKPFQFTLGTSAVIRGWHKGLEGMCVGEKRMLKIGPELAYGSKGSPPNIPPHATLFFDIELLAFDNFSHKELENTNNTFVFCLVLVLVFGIYLWFRNPTGSAPKKPVKKNHLQN